MLKEKKFKKAFSFDEIEKLTREIGLSFLKVLKKKEIHLFDKKLWYGRVLSQTMKSDSFKTSLFRFIDVLPNLQTPKEILSHLKEYFKDQESKWFLSGLRLSDLAPSLSATVIKKQTEAMAKIFIAGASSKEALKIVSQMRKDHQLFSIDILGEVTLSEKEALKYQSQYLSLMDDFIEGREKWSTDEQLDRDSLGPIPSINVSVKASALSSQIKEEAWEFSKRELKNRLRPIFKKAVENFIFINLDMEHYQHKTLYNEVFKELLSEPSFKSYPHFGIVLQAYLKKSFEDLKDLKSFAEVRGCPITVRLVRGAYWDSEVIVARQKNWPLPVYVHKEETDLNFERCTEYLMKNHQFMKTAVGSHNIRSIAKALALHKVWPEASLEFQFLYGMGEDFAHSLSQFHYPARFYTTVGELIPGMSYLVRRLLENTSNQSFIKNTMEDKTEDCLLPPKPQTRNIQGHQKEDFLNYPPRDFSLRENRSSFETCLKEWKGKLPCKVPLIINGKEIFHSEWETRENPGNIKETVSFVNHASKEETEKAIQSVLSFFPKWRDTSPSLRAEKLKKLADLIKEKEFLFSALEVLEVGKTWDEAQRDVSEAIDFCIYYAESLLKLCKKQKTMKVLGEENFSQYESIGVCAVIAPWNFPLAILTGMTVAPLVCGNTVLIKPAEQSSLIAYEFAKLLLESGFPSGSFSFLPGQGEVVGDYLVKHPQVPLISFTGSYEVGAAILKEAAVLKPGQKHIKKCVTEMGGKNTIIIDESADLDEAVLGVIESAFGFQGQKCSACGKVVVLKGIYENFLDRFLPAVESLIVCNPEDPKAFMGPVIDRIAFERINQVIKDNKGKIFGSPSLSKEGYYISPTVFVVDDIESSLMKQEIFGPVLALLKADHLDQALQYANDSSFGLTAGLYSRHPGNIEKFKTLMEAGNVYINRNCTGALVKRHPFGGRKMSGVGSKAGGPEYLKQFLIAKVTTENTMRRGFSPEIFSLDFFETE